MGKMYFDAVTDAITLISRKAKQLGIKKEKLYEDGNHNGCNEAKVSSIFLYGLKEAAIKKAVIEGVLELKGITVQIVPSRFYYDDIDIDADFDNDSAEDPTTEVELLTYVSLRGEVFHLPINESIEAPIIGCVEGKSPSSKQMYGAIETCDAIKYIGDYVGQEALVRCCKSAIEVSRDKTASLNEALRIFPELKGYCVGERIYACFVPGKMADSDKIIVIEKRLFSGISLCGDRNQFKPEQYYEYSRMPNGFAMETLYRDAWEENLSKEEVARAYVNWLGSPQNFFEERLGRRKRQNSFRTDEIVGKNLVRIIRAGELNKRIGRDDVALSSEAEAEAFLYNRFVNILMDNQDIHDDDLVLPPIDAKKEREIITLYPDMTNICGKLYPLRYSRASSGLVVYVDIIKDVGQLVNGFGDYAAVREAGREAIRRLGGSSKDALDGTYIPAGNKVQGNKAGASISELMADLIRYRIELAQDAFIDSRHHRYRDERVKELAAEIEQQRLSTVLTAVTDIPLKDIWNDDRDRRYSTRARLTMPTEDNVVVDRIVIGHDDIVGEIAVYGVLALYYWYGEIRPHHRWVKNPDEALELQAETQRKIKWIYANAL